MENSEDPGKRRKGAQPGNNNAIKDGFYSRYFKKRDITDLQKYDFDGLKDEIELFRVQIRRISEMSADIKNLHEAIDYLYCFSHALDCLSRLVRANYFVFNDQDGSSDMQKAITQVLMERAAELDARREAQSPFPPPAKLEEAPGD